MVWRVWLFMLMGATGCIVDDWRYRPLDAALADADVAKPTDEDVLVAPDADVPDADAAPPPPDMPLSDIPPPPPGVVVRGGIAPSGAHVSATVRVRGTLTLGARHCNAAGTVCVSGGISP